MKVAKASESDATAEFIANIEGSSRGRDDQAWIDPTTVPPRIAASPSGSTERLERHYGLVSDRHAPMLELWRPSTRCRTGGWRPHVHENTTAGRAGVNRPPRAGPEHSAGYNPVSTWSNFEYGRKLLRRQG